MAQMLVLIRHGKAQTRSPERGDFERTLTEVGRRALVAWMPKSAELLKGEPVVKEGGRLEVWASPSARTLETAAIVADCYGSVLKAGKLEVVETPCLWSQDVQEFLGLVRESSADVIIAVGHNPFCDDVAAHVCGSAVAFATGGVACLQLGDAACENEQDAEVWSGRLMWFVQGPEAKRWKRVRDLEKVIEAASDNIDTRLTTFLENTDDVEAAHKARVSIRTMRGLLAFVKPFQSSAQNKQMNADLRTNVASTSRLRELDVLREQVAQLEPVADDLLEACNEQRDLECARTVAALTSKGAQKRFARVAKAARSIEWKRPLVQYGLDDDAVRLRFEQVASEVSADLASLDLADAERTHDVRKRAKQVRYAAERFGDLIGPEAADVAEDMKAVQDRLGALCDARVNVELVDSFPTDGLSERALWDLKLLRAQNEAFVLNALRNA